MTRTSMPAAPALPRTPAPRRLATLLALACAAALPARAGGDTAPLPPASDAVVVAPQAPQLTPGYWIARLPAPDTPYLAPAAIAAQNARMLARDPHLEDLERLPEAIPARAVAASLQALSQRPTRTLFDLRGEPLDAAALDALLANLALERIPATVAPRFGLVVARADLRTFPTTQRVFSTRGDLDIDRFQESALFPGDAVAVLHESRDGRWWFVASQRYRAWIARDRVALGTRAQVLGYARRSPARVITGAVLHTTYTPDAPALSALQLDMGIRLPLRADWPADAPVNGQHPYTAWVLDLPVRGDDGRLDFAPALLPRNADSAADVLPATPAHLIAQAFKFLGERYGWGHAFDARDCSGFVSEIYRSVGILLPRNTGAQASSPALAAVPLPPAGDRAGRLAALQSLRAGDLVYIPGHVMMVIGHDRGQTWVIHDTAGASYADADGRLVRARLNGVAVTPLEPLRLDADTLYLDRITRIQRLPAPSLPE